MFRFKLEFEIFLFAKDMSDLYVLISSKSDQLLSLEATMENPDDDDEVRTLESSDRLTRHIGGKWGWTLVDAS